MKNGATLTAIRSQMLGILERLDELGLSRSGAHLAMAIHCLEPESFDCEARSDSADANARSRSAGPPRPGEEP